METGEPPPAATPFQALLAAMVRHDASDLHLKAGSPPVVRVKGACRPLSAPPLAEAAVKAAVYESLSEEQLRSLLTEGSVDLAIQTAEGRFRLNVFRERGRVSVALRRVRDRIPTFEELGLPLDTMERILAVDEGLVLVCGPTGSGKTTTLAAILDRINASQRCHIATVEDPIEYLLSDKKAIVTQREIGIDVPSFREALRNIVRQDPDVILVGEMRDGETFDAALAAAETGHLVFATLHAAHTAQSVQRILELYPEGRHAQVRLGLHFNLRAVLCQKLLPATQGGSGGSGGGGGGGRIAATEALFVTATVRDFIRNAEDHKIPDLLRTSREPGMHDFNQSLHRLVRAGVVAEAEAIAASPAPEALRMRLAGFSPDEARSGISG